MERQINRDQLVDFAKKVYQRACFGHLDLMDNFCEAAASELFNELPDSNNQLNVNQFSHLKHDQFPHVNMSTITVSQETVTFDSHLTITNTTDLN